jgi:hypothetical protein
VPKTAAVTRENVFGDGSGRGAAAEKACCSEEVGCLPDAAALGSPMQILMW